MAPVANPYWADATEAAEALIAACLLKLDEWGVTTQDAGGDLPVRGVYGVPEQWPHIRGLYRRAGFAPTGSTEAGPDLSAGGEDEAGYRAFLAASGFAELTRTLRGWTRSPRPREP